MTRRTSVLLRRAALGLLALSLASLAGTRPVHAAQIVPSIGTSQTPDGGDNQVILGIALRNGFLPRTQAEIQISHLSEKLEYAGQSLELRTIPVTASLWASPVPMLYAGGGVGAYFQAIEYGNNIYPASNDTQFGAHLGAGMRFSVTPMIGLDLQGRYVFMEEKSTQLASGNFDPSFWTLSAGVAIGF